jgi:Zn-dependent peptidase ImmA (M78 family)
MSHTRRGVPITPAVLEWAIQESGYSLEEVAGSIDVEAELLVSWINDERRPSRTQLEAIARKLKRASAIFYLESPPKRAQRTVEFRHPRSVARTTLNPEERRYLRFAVRLQDQMAWMLNESGARRVALPTARLQDAPEEASDKLRSWIDLDGLGRQAPNNDAAFGVRRDLVQSKGIAVCVLRVGRGSTQGFALWNEMAPVIVINSTGWNGASRSFSLLHELAHLALRSDSACYQPAGRVQDYEHDGEVEVWCNRVAAASLMPWREVSRDLASRFGLGPDERVKSLDVATALANSFRVSVRSAVLRLIEHHRASWELWEAIPPVSDHRQGGGGRGMNRAQRRLGEFGKRSIQVYLEAERQGVITRNDVRDALRLGDRDIQSVEARLSAD